eukprot:TRINITY_DN15046_c0_g1_i1.p1 TRINITY_DN15046_c0_g1~~TRINITY_DN15046_c0_g1_i1.p1  ORF type:complete len:187 (-),score=36.06 TRINITY_DN15046_c0_g1_i1:366-926(-)
MSYVVIFFFVYLRMCTFMSLFNSFFFFFFKQKTAYEMLRSLVGSEMCIRDRVSTQSTGGLNCFGMAMTRSPQTTRCMDWSGSFEARASLTRPYHHPPAPSMKFSRSAFGEVDKVSQSRREPRGPLPPRGVHAFRDSWLDWSRDCPGRREGGGIPGSALRGRGKKIQGGPFGYSAKFHNPTSYRLTN